MKVLKFGGTSVANAENISKVIKILGSESKKNKIAVVVSALGGTTDMLIEAGNLATNKDEKYIEVFQNIVNRHINTVEELIDNKNKQAVLNEVNTKLEELKQTEIKDLDFHLKYYRGLVNYINSIPETKIIENQT